MDEIVRPSLLLFPRRSQPSVQTCAPENPVWWVFLLLPAIHFATVRLSFFCAVTPENEVVVWLPNAVLLAALLRFRGRYGLVMASLTFSSDMIANLPEFPWYEAILLSLVNVFEVASTFLLMRHLDASPRLERIQDLVTFVVTGPLVSALLAGFLGAAIIKALESGTTPYLTLMRVWWFGDGLGLLIYTPLLLSFAFPSREVINPTRLDGAVILLTLALAGVIFSQWGENLGGLSATPTLLLPSVLFMAARLGVRWTTVAVALISLTTSWVLTTGRNPFGDTSSYLAIAHAQEFILTLSIVGLGFAVLLRDLKITERNLEAKVRERTHELEEINDKLATLSATDALTGVANRRRFDDVLANEWARAKRTGQPLALVLLDVDLFKNYNDFYGHQSGDECLRAIGELLRAHAHRCGDLVARYGGEEFAFVVAETGAAGAATTAHSICQAVQAAGLPHATSPFGVVTASLGVAISVPRDGGTPEMLVTRADKALYQAKERGRNTVVIADPATTTQE